MIQQTNARQAGTSLRGGAVDGSELTWGLWSGRKLYALEVIQNPLRARMCGFGDKDRRPLAPAAVVKMVVKREDDTVVDVDEVDCSFFLVTVDLWSGDGKQEMNLVLHPSSSERYVQQTPKSSSNTRRRASKSGQPPNPTRTPTPTQTPTSPEQPYPPYPPPTTDLAYPETTPTWGYPSNSFPPQQPPQSFGREPWQEKRPPPTPSIPPLPRHTYTRTLVGPLSANATRLLDEHRKPGIFFLFQDLSVRTEGTFRLRLRLMNVGAPPAPEAGASGVHTDVSPVLAQTFTEPFTVFSAKRFPGVPGIGGCSTLIGLARFSQPSQYKAINDCPHGKQEMNLVLHPSLAERYVQQQQQTPKLSEKKRSSPTPLFPSLPRHTYTRTLIGPITANATRLLDEHRKPGIFFLFQDLSVRTEGTFRLRLRLVNVGAPPAPEAGASAVHTGISPVLAQTFTEPFTVFSAKRFPGVPDMTGLSIALGNQGQKLPLRSRNGSNKRRRYDSSSEDMDGA
ncbi:velvet factor [Desarmillaria tabescens]|uniref:Velvet factor n=1 Tax=Armillaria tabescens TaxID=1929756 RepID=A0AA39NA16_ARMTA|nr:velvet factor [Desarmillaria tabescens]KAK0461815.1 velvet factor [Desarmillaria tabescens]